MISSIPGLLTWRHHWKGTMQNLVNILLSWEPNKILDKIFIEDLILEPYWKLSCAATNILTHQQNMWWAGPLKKWSHLVFTTKQLTHQQCHLTSPVNQSLLVEFFYMEVVMASFFFFFLTEVMASFHSRTLDISILTGHAQSHFYLKINK